MGRDAIRWAHARSEPGARTLSDDDARALAQMLASLDERAWARGDAPIDAREIERVADRVAGGGL